jgi:hypothetical protein
MAPWSSQPQAVRAVRLWGLFSLFGWVALAAARFESRPFLRLGFHDILGIAAWTILLHLILRLVETLAWAPGEASWRDYARGYALMLLGGWTFLWYFNAHRVGPLDAQWYENAMTEFLTQFRSGTFPVVLGASIHSFNGAVHPFRSAPWQFVLAAGVDLLSGGTLAPVAVQHITAIASFCAALLILYVGFARSRPGSRNTAWLFAIAYATAPAATVPFFQYDMYMTLTAQPVMAAALVCLQRAIDEDSVVASGWLGVFLAALWYCHPPMALLTGMVAGSCMTVGIAIRGFAPRRVLGALVGAATFGALAAPYFLSMSELSSGDPDTLARLVMPLAGVTICLIACAGYLRTRYLPWLALLPTAYMCLRDFQPTLVAFAACFAALMIPCAWVTRRHSRRNDAAWVAVCALLAALLACTAFAGISIPAGIGTWIPRSWGAYFEPIVSGTRMQPGYLLWLLVLAMVMLVFAARTSFAQLCAAATLVIVVALGACGALSRFLWGNVPWDITKVLGTNYDFRLVPILGVMATVGGFYWLASARMSHWRIGRAVQLLVVLILPWALWQDIQVLYLVRDFKLDLRQTEVRNRPENDMLEQYSWDLLPMTGYLSNGVMDPFLETRFWSDDNHAKAMIGPDELERSLEQPGQRPIGLVATPVPTGKSWLTMEPRIELEPGQRVLLRFDFLGKYIDDGYLIIQGQQIYREYRLPSSGREFAFGLKPGNTHTLSLWNSGSTRESIQLLVTRYGPHAFDPPGDGPYWNLFLSNYAPERVPVALQSLVPLKIRVTAPTDGYVETFRSSIPGYKVYVDGKQDAAHTSRNQQVSVRVPRGTHNLWIRFAGTVRLHTAIRWAETAWAIAALAAVAQLFTMMGSASSFRFPTDPENVP